MAIVEGAYQYWFSSHFSSVLAKNMFLLATPFPFTFATSGTIACAGTVVIACAGAIAMSKKYQVFVGFELREIDQLVLSVCYSDGLSIAPISAMAAMVAAGCLHCNACSKLTDHSCNYEEDSQVILQL